MLPPDALVAHVGDSRAYLCRGSGLSRLTKDHTLTQALADAGLLDAGDVSRHPKRGILTRAVGHGEGELTIEVSRVHVEPGDQVLLCTDGLTDELSDDDIRMALTTSSSAALASQALVDLALDRGGRDNVTAIVGRVSKGRSE
jgi:protein phosphatase